MPKKIITLTIISVFILTGCQVKTPKMFDRQEPVVCPADAKICPDGSAVGRTGQNCEFALCPNEASEVENSGYQKISFQSIVGVSSKFKFESQIPNNWQVEFVPKIESINIFDPEANGDNNLEKSQIFIRFFEASSFLTLQTVTIYSQKNTTVANRPAVIYDIEKKSNIANFANQPLWRSGRHIVTDIRTTDLNPTIFYVIAKNPNLDQKIYDNFLNNLLLNNSSTKLTSPVANFNERITKKPFGIFINPESSPVQPEKFTGYHNGVDIEYQDIENDVPVYAIADGTVIYSAKANGYGGMVLIKHMINNQNYVAIYGHLKPSSLIKNNKAVKAGEKIGLLGEGYSDDTDGERKHLHFSLRLGDDINLAGYVKNKSDLANWTDPQIFFKS